MGWNSWDCYGAGVTEEQLLGNAEYMAEHLKPFGWQYIVCDIQWYEPKAVSFAYHGYAPLEMDEYSRLIPAVSRFPSAAGGAGFRPIADRIHGLGLKFGIHVMRGIPRQAVHNDTPILGTEARARSLAAPFSPCPWNTDMYGVNPEAAGAQEYYNSLFRLYASWGVDFVKVDDICCTKFDPGRPYAAEKEIELIRHAIDGCGREIVLSLSPGPAVIEKSWHLAKNANMWRMTDDFWDNWGALKEMFERCEVWCRHVRPGCWPDCDMLPLGHLALNDGSGGRMTNFTRDEQITMMTLWCIFRSPLMMGGELRDCDAWTLSLLTNPEVLRLETDCSGADQLARDEQHAAWCSHDSDGSVNLALFNLSDETAIIGVSLAEAGLQGRQAVRDLWAHRDLAPAESSVSAEIPPHGAVLYKLSSIPG
jgi:alpha-galactosidase